ncbi:MAG: DUF1571 domain-containing protein [Bacteroidales bacterium]|nr:DUF1571 domain-containing protein [Bacteroidales bacterium]
MIKKLLLIGIALLGFLTLQSTTREAESRQILKRLIEINSKISSLKVTVLMSERVENKMANKKADFKLAYNPVKIYLKQEYPNKGMEVLYNEALYGKKAVINPNSFPWINLTLDPLGNTMRAGQHHSIFKSGYAYLVSVLDHLLNKYSDSYDKMVLNQGIVKYNNVYCHKIVFDDPNFKYVDYTVQPGENLEILSRKLKVNDYMIYTMNKNIKSFEDITPGLTIKVPNDYARKIIVYIDRDILLPLGLEIYDEKGLFQEYIYSNIQVNPHLKPQEFEKEYPEYGF